MKNGGKPKKGECVMNLLILILIFLWSMAIIGTIMFFRTKGLIKSKNMPETMEELNLNKERIEG